MCTHTHTTTTTKSHSLLCFHKHIPWNLGLGKQNRTRQTQQTNNNKTKTARAPALMIHTKRHSRFDGSEWCLAACTRRRGLGGGNSFRLRGLERHTTFIHHKNMIRKHTIQHANKQIDTKKQSQWVVSYNNDTQMCKVLTVWLPFASLQSPSLTQDL